MEDQVAAWRALLLAQHRVLRAIDKDLDRAGVIALTSYDVLLELAAAPDGSLRMQDLAGRVVLSRSRVSRLVDDLERRGYVERLPDPDDGRACLAHLTSDGRAAFRRAAPVYLRGIREHFTRHLEPDERVVLTRALERVIAAHDST